MSATVASNCGSEDADHRAGVTAMCCAASAAAQFVEHEMDRMPLPPAAAWGLRLGFGEVPSDGSVKLGRAQFWHPRIGHPDILAPSRIDRSKP
jgi:hypothetical protein